MNEKKSLLNSLMHLAKIDGKMVEREYTFLCAIAKQMGLPISELDDLLKKEKFEFVPPENEFERILQFQRMVLMMSVDEKTTVIELNYVRTMGLKMGLHPGAIDTVLSEMKNYPGNMIPPETLLTIFKRHHN